MTFGRDEWMKTQGKKKIALIFYFVTIYRTWWAVRISKREWSSSRINSQQHIEKPEICFCSLFLFSLPFSHSRYVTSVLLSAIRCHFKIRMISLLWLHLLWTNLLTRVMKTIISSERKTRFNLEPWFINFFVRRLQLIAQRYHHTVKMVR